MIARSAIAAPSSPLDRTADHRDHEKEVIDGDVVLDPAGVLGIAERLLDQLDEASPEEALAGRSRRRGMQAVHQTVEAGLDLGDGPQESPDSLRASLAVMEAMVTRNFGF